MAITAALAWQGAGADSGGLPGCGAEGGCAEVISSSYIRLLGVSLTIFAFVHYAAAGIVLAVSQWLGSRTIGAALSLLLPVLASAAVTTGLWAVAIMLFVLQAACAWCLAVHVANAVFFILAIVCARSHWRSAQRQRAEQELAALPARIPVAAAFGDDHAPIHDRNPLGQFQHHGHIMFDQ